MAVNLFASDYIGMANSTLNQAGWDIFLPSGQIAPHYAPSGTYDTHFYEGDWIGVRAVEETWLFTDGDIGGNKLQDDDFETLMKTHDWDSDKALVRISPGDILYGAFNKVKILEGYALGIRSAKAPPSDVIYTKDAAGNYNPYDFPGLVAKYDMSRLASNTTNDYGTVDGSGNITLVKNTSGWQNRFNIALPDLVDPSDRLASRGGGVPNLIADAGTSNMNVANFNALSKDWLSMDYFATSSVMRLMSQGSPVTFVFVMETDLQAGTVSDWERHLVSSDFGAGLGTTGNFTIAQWKQQNTPHNICEWGMTTNEASSSYITTGANSNTTTGTYQVLIMTAWDQNDNSGNWYTSRCSIYENDPLPANNKVHNQNIFTSNRVNDNIVGFNVGIGAPNFSFGLADGTWMGNAANITTADCFDGKIGEILIYNKPMSLFERTNTINYLKNKWEI